MLPFEILLQAMLYHVCQQTRSQTKFGTKFMFMDESPRIIAIFDYDDQVGFSPIEIVSSGIHNDVVIIVA